ncbi:hypothetical protein OA162_00205 [Synechococcus sp. AH-736-A19]|nr:hypothetical protein [Synechococcus sp. AH-736-A19]
MPQQQPAGGWLRVDVAQLSQGRLEGTFRLGGSRQLPVLSIQTNAETDPA